MADLHQTEQRKVSFEDIIPTGYLTAYPRSLTDIPHARLLYEAFLGIASREGIDLPSVEHGSLIAEGIQLRHLLIDRMMAEYPSKQILEIAAGLSPRGFAMASGDPSLQYVELDLAAMADIKVESIQTFSEIPSNLQIGGCNVLSGKDVIASVDHFDKNQPITIVNEGLLGYMSFAEKRQLGGTIHQLLSMFGGAWITSDVISRPKSSEDVAGRDKVLSRQLFSSDVFTTEQEFTDFFTESGFNVRINKAHQGDEAPHLGAYSRVAALTT